MSDRPATFAPLSPNETRAARSRSLSRRPSHSSLASTSNPPLRANPSASTTRSSASTTGATVAGVPPLPTHASPHYSTSIRSRHSLYGTEDRIVLDLGSRVWKVGFSGEPSPRHCVRVDKLLAKEALELGTARRDKTTDQTDENVGIWGLTKGEVSEQELDIREERLKRGLRQVWFDHLMTDPKTRKVLVVENPLLSTQVKDMIARVLFDNLQVPAINFASTPLLSLMTAGAVTGLVVDVGHLETTVLPVFHSRPLFSKVASTPLAGSRLNARLRSLLLAYGSYAPPPPSLNSMTIPQPTKVPAEVLTEELIEEIKTRCCFVGDEVMDDERLLREYDDELNQRYRRDSSIDTSASSAMDVDSTSSAPAFDDSFDPDLPLLKYLYSRYSRTSPSTTSLSFRIPHLSSLPPPSGVGKGHLSIPSWVRERSAEILFDSTLETQDALSIQSTILECVLDLPIDLRRPMVENLVVTGGTASLPGFIPRLKQALLTRLEHSHPPSPPPSPPPPGSAAPTVMDPVNRIRRSRLASRLHSLRHSPRYAPLASLTSSVSILNSPSPLANSQDSPPPGTEGSAPGFHPSLYAWVGGSLAGSLKVGGPEILREDWEEGWEQRAREDAGRNEDDESFATDEGSGSTRRDARAIRVHDWSRPGHI